MHAACTRAHARRGFALFDGFFSSLSLSLSLSLWERGERLCKHTAAVIYRFYRGWNGRNILFQVFVCVNGIVVGIFCGRGRFCILLNFRHYEWLKLFQYL